MKPALINSNDLHTLAAALGVAVEDGLPQLKERQRRDVEDVAAGRRTARSLWAIQKGDTEKYTFEFNPDSEYEREGEGW
jgi:hypothetical protein